MELLLIFLLAAGWSWARSAMMKRHKYWEDYAGDPKRKNFFYD